MASAVVKSFEGSAIKNGSFRYLSDTISATQLPVGCVGKISGTTDVKTKQKLCGGVPQKTISTPNEHTVTISGQVRADFVRKIYGLTNEGLKSGVFAYGPGSSPEPFMFTVNVIDEFDGITKLMAFPSLTVKNGYAMEYDASQDSFEGVEIELSANLDDNGNWFYEAFTGEADVSIQNAWHTNWKPDLMKLTV